LKEFFEDYDDDRDDVKYYKGGALQRRLNDREKEMESDERDRMKEREELEEIRRRLLEEGHPDPEAEMERIEREREEHLLPRLQQSPVGSESPDVAIIPEPVPPPSKKKKSRRGGSSVRSSDNNDSDDNNYDDDDNDNVVEVPAVKEDTSSPVNTKNLSVSPEPPAVTTTVSTTTSSSIVNTGLAPPIISDDSISGLSQNFPTHSSSGSLTDKAKLSFAGILNKSESRSPSVDRQSKRKKLTVDDVFNNDDDDESTMSKKRKLVPLDYSEEERAAISGRMAPVGPAASAEEKRKSIKTLIERIPTAKEDLFAYPLDWTMVDSTLMDRRIKPWVNKKIVEYIGEDEPTLSDFICKKVTAHSTPSSILADISMVLDEEAEVFVVKMWRLLIYETEAKKLGLVSIK
jgi:RNA-binding protein 25